MTAWQPTTSLRNLRLRVKLLACVRDFFAKRNVLEVETPLLSQHTVTDVHIDSFQTTYQNGKNTQHYFLQTSPEYAMKRLLAAGSGSIFQICKAFRNSESGQQHNPEFTMLEWYRPDFTHHELMTEVDALLQLLLNTAPAERVSYQDLWIKKIGINPHDCELIELQRCIAKQGLTITSPIDDKDTLLQLLMSHAIEPTLGLQAPLFIYDYPITQAALAKISGNPPVAERFEAYFQGVELANGFHELTDATEQFTRFQREQDKRKAMHRLVPTIDARFIDALTHGLPSCSGVAVGLDRLLMIMANAKTITEVISFPWERA